MRSSKFRLLPPALFFVYSCSPHFLLATTRSHFCFGVQQEVSRNNSRTWCRDANSSAGRAQFTVQWCAQLVYGLKTLWNDTTGFLHTMSKCTALTTLTLLQLGGDLPVLTPLIGTDWRHSKFGQKVWPESLALMPVPSHHCYNTANTHINISCSLYIARLHAVVTATR